MLYRQDHNGNGGDFVPVLACLFAKPQKPNKRRFNLSAAAKAGQIQPEDFGRLSTNIDGLLFVFGVSIV